jgi:hypothetical protein
VIRDVAKETGLLVRVDGLLGIHTKYRASDQRTQRAWPKPVQ